MRPLTAALARRSCGILCAMQIPYTYWPAKEGGYIGYWNDYPDYLTEGDTLAELRDMLRDLRDGINVMVSKGEIPSATPCRSGVMELA